MNLWLLVPVKPYDEAKSRLARVLALTERTVLLRNLMARTLQLASTSQLFAQIIVISRDQAVLEAADQLNALAVVEQHTDLNLAVAQGASVATQAGAAGLLILPIDLPTLLPSDLNALCALAESGVDIVLAASRDGGTNALFIRLPSPIPFYFGPGGFERHRQAAVAAGCTIAVYASPTLAFDLDWPEDLAALSAEGV